MNNAMQDAGDLVDAVKTVVLGKVLLKDAVSGNDDAMRPRGARDVELSLETATKLLVSNLRESPMFKVGLQKMNGEQVLAVSNAVQLRD